MPNLIYKIDVGVIICNIFVTILHNYKTNSHALLWKNDTNFLGKSYRFQSFLISSNSINARFDKFSIFLKNVAYACFPMSELYKY